MVRCMMNGVVWNSCKDNVADDLGEESDYEDEYYYQGPGVDVLEYERKRESKAIARAIKVVEDDFDEFGHPRVKIFYFDAGDWSMECLTKTQYQQDVIEDTEKLHFAKFTAENYVPPRLIFVIQYRDYWPGSETYPDAMKMHALKYDTFLKSGFPPDRKRIHVPYHQEDCDGMYSLYFDIDRPGTKFILENMDNDELYTTFQVDGNLNFSSALATYEVFYSSKIRGGAAYSKEYISLLGRPNTFDSICSYQN